MKKTLLTLVAMLPLLAFAQGENAQDPPKQTPTLVSITAKATDVRAVIADLFTQAKKNFVLQPGVQFALYLNLEKIEFEEALHIICQQSKLTFEVQNGIYFVSKAKAPVVAAAVPPAPKGKLDQKVLEKKVTTKLLKTDIKAVFAEFAKQTQLTLEVDKSAPAFKLDAILTNVSLKYALDKVTEATGLKYRFTDNLSIEIYKPADSNKVAISGG